MSILRNPSRHRYTIVDSFALEDPSISFEAKGVLAYLLSKPDGWSIRQEHLSRVGGIGRHKIMRIFSELRKAGYIAYNKPRNELGHVEGTEIVLCETPFRADADPVAKSDHRINRESENPTVGKPDPIVIKDLLVNLKETVNTEVKTKDIAPPSATPKSKKPTLDYSSWPTMPSDQVMIDWLALRRSKRAPVSQTVINAFGKSLSLAAMAGHTVDDCLTECISRGWIGFRLDWYENAIRQRGNNHDQYHDKPRPGSFDDIASRIGQHKGIQNCGRIFDDDGALVEEAGRPVRERLF